MACGVIAPYAVGQADVVSIGTYPGYSGSYDVKGMLLEKPIDSTGIQFVGLFTGLLADSTGDWHAHEGSTCTA